jgi:predicted DNA-binding protein YlxM (UPF0122 family)
MHMKYASLIPIWKEKYENGASFREIAEEYAINKNTVSRTLDGHVDKRPRSKWNKYGERWLTLYEDGYTKTEIAKKDGASIQVVSKILKRMGVATEGKKKFQHLASKWINEYKNGDNLTIISQRYGVSRQTVLNYLNDEGVEARGYDESSRIYTLHEDYFEGEMTEEKVFFLGLLFSIGTTFEAVKSWVTHLSFHQKKRSLFQPLLTRLKGEEIEEGSMYMGTDGVYRIRLHSEKLAISLRKYGLTEKKTKEIHSLNEDFYQPFLAGFLIGGSSLFQKKNDLFITAPLPMLTSLRPILSTVIHSDAIYLKQKEGGYMLSIYRNKEVNTLLRLKKRYIQQFLFIH